MTRRLSLVHLLAPLTAAFLIGCGMPAPNATVNTNTNSNANAVANSNTNTNTSSTGSVVDTKEPDQYQATVSLKLQAIGNQNTELPSISAVVSRKGADRRMEFTNPVSGHVIYLDKNGTNYLILPDKKQYAELDKDSLGIDVRRLLMPEQIVEQAKKLQGMTLVGDDRYNGRDVVKYQYAAAANTNTQAGQVATQSYLYIDKQTGLPLHTETVSQSQSGGNVQGYNGIRLITEMTDINTAVGDDLFAAPTNLQKIDAAQVKAQVELIFNILSTALAQTLKQAAPAASASATP